MNKLELVLKEIEDKRLNMNSSDVEAILIKSANDFRFGFFFQLGVIMAIFILTTIGVVKLWGDNDAVAAFLGALGVGGVGWFVREIRLSMHQGAMIQLLIAGSKNLKPEQMNALIELVGKTVSR